MRGIAVPSTPSVFGSPIRGLLLTVGALVLGAVVLLGAHLAGHTEIAAHAVMTAIFAAGVALGCMHALQLHAWCKETVREFEHLRQVRSVRRFLSMTMGSTTPARCLIDELVAGVRPGRAAALDHLIENMLDSLLKLPQLLRLLASTLVQLGLLGTSVGSIFALSDLATLSTTTRAGGTDLFAELLGPGSAMSGLALAFASTAVGLATSIVLRAIAASLENAARDYATEVSKLVIAHVNPDIWIDGGGSPTREEAS